MIRILAFSLVLLACSRPEPVFNKVDPEKAGFSASGLDTLAGFLDSAGSSGMLILVDGQKAFEWGDIQRKHTIHSIRKSLISSLYGIYIGEGLIDTSATIGELGIDDLEPLSENEKGARIADLLKSRSGVYHDAAAVSAGMRIGKPERDTYLPGEHYYYNNWDFNVLGAILEQATGKSIFQLFHERIAQPIGMQFNGTFAEIDGEDPNAELPETDAFYQHERSKSRYPAYHFRLSATDLALFGQLYINGGEWNGNQIISEDWIEVSTRPYSMLVPQVGIGYGMLWRVLVPNEWRNARSFYHTGSGVHMLGVYPGSKLVMVHRVDTENEYDFKGDDLLSVINLMWDARD